MFFVFCFSLLVNLQSSRLEISLYDSFFSVVAAAAAIGGDGGKSKFVVKFNSGDGLLRLYEASVRVVFESQEGFGPGSRCYFVTKRKKKQFHS